MSAFDSTAKTGGSDAAVTGTLGSVPLRSGSHPWLPVNAASQPRVPQVGGSVEVRPAFIFAAASTLTLTAVPLPLRALNLEKRK